MPQRDVRRVIAAKAAAQRHKVRVAILLAHQRHHLVNQVVLILHVARDPPARRHVAVVPALHVDRIDAEELQMSRFDLAPTAPIMPRSSNS